MRLAPQQTRTFHVTAVTAQRRRLFQVTTTADLLQPTLLDYRSQTNFYSTPSSSCPTIYTPSSHLRPTSLLKRSCSSSKAVFSTSGSAASTKPRFKQKPNSKMPSDTSKKSRSRQNGRDRHQLPILIRQPPPIDPIPKHFNN
jgi:hypothetical protein